MEGLGREHTGRKGSTNRTGSESGRRRVQKIRSGSRDSRERTQYPYAGLRQGLRCFSYPSCMVIALKFFLVREAGFHSEGVSALSEATLLAILFDTFNNSSR